MGSRTIKSNKILKTEGIMETNLEMEKRTYRKFLRTISKPS